jgi:hypothetical protein
MNASITNSSLDLLRSSSSLRNDKKEDNRELMNVWAQLVEIKAELRSLHYSEQLSDLEPTISSALSKLDKCLENVAGANQAYGRNTAVHSGTGKLTTKESKTSINSTGREWAATAKPAGDVTTKESTESVSSSGPENPTPIATQQETMVLEGTTEITDKGGPPSLRHAVEMLAGENDATALRIGSQILYLYFVNLSGKPDNARYRKIYTSNESFQKVEKLKGAKELLFSVGFQEQKGCLEWLPNGSAEQEIMFLPKLNAGTSALSILKSGNTNLKDAALAKLSLLDEDKSTSNTS